MREILEAISTMMPMLIGILGAFFITYGGDGNMNDMAILGIVGTVIGILVTMLVELVKTFRDGGILKDTKKDTADMKPKVDDIKAGVDSTNMILLDAVKPAIQNVNEQTKKIDNIVNTMSRFDGMVQSSKGNVMRPDEMLAHMKAVYDERYELLKENQSLKVELLQISAENRQLRKEKQAIEKRYNTLLEQTHPDDELEFEM